ncbi:hypothetical protein [Candidatus Symbiopectobacterium sp. NZEC135]|uniref:hypothetical protein n=1 Tax=Candidatus Symbiopectobacterium sp. NZEC135 TaxID=2820471 RepID=UPI002227FBDE|nr:hypothetical protein [Candidatus Symbiopectobacterium sp. NZEC135]MCW2478870.1 hypothetical protein [Candidatus Symbiopectobacterium sp. NZEC135]
MLIGAIILIMVGLFLALFAGYISSINSTAFPPGVTVVATLLCIGAIALAYSSGKEEANPPKKDVKASSNNTSVIIGNGVRP